jgi:hypothetical protein
MAFFCTNKFTIQYKSIITYFDYNKCSVKRLINYQITIFVTGAAAAGNVAAAAASGQPDTTIEHVDYRNKLTDIRNIYHQVRTFVCFSSSTYFNFEDETSFELCSKRQNTLFYLKRILLRHLKFLITKVSINF